jgi:hypothetical protein
MKYFYRIILVALACPLGLFAQAPVPAATTSQPNKPAQEQKAVPASKQPGIFLDFNPHLAMYRFGKIDNNICLFCHSVTPVSNPRVVGKRNNLNSTVNGLCSSCHGQSPHTGILEHSGKIGEKMLKKIKLYESQAKKSVSVSESGFLLCTTCHDPHPDGVIKSLDADYYKDYSFLKSQPKTKTKMAAVFENAMLDKLKRAGLTGKSSNPIINQVELPFRFELNNGKICKVCHELN